MTGESARSKNGEIYRYYSCNGTKSRYRNGCTKKRVPKDWIESEVIRVVMDEILTDQNIELLADAFEKELSKTGSVILKERFSPGYGDLSIECQKEIFSALECSRKIGVSLNESLLMSPSKSISAIIGVLDNENKNN